MILIEDSRNKIGKHDNILRYCKDNGIEVQRKVLNVGDYMLPQGTKAIDTKADIEELANDLFRDSKELNKKYKKCYHNKIKLIVLTEEPIKDIEELKKWESKHSKINGRFLLNMIHTIQISYGIRFIFCNPQDTGTKILELLKE